MVRENRPDSLAVNCLQFMNSNMDSIVQKSRQVCQESAIQCCMKSMMGSKVTYFKSWSHDQVKSGPWHLSESLTVNIYLLRLVCQPGLTFKEPLMFCRVDFIESWMSLAEPNLVECISRSGGSWLLTTSCTWNGMFVVSANHLRLIARNCVVSSSVRRWRHELHSLLYRRIDETVTVNNSETAEVQGEATARREQCGYIVHNPLHLD